MMISAKIITFVGAIALMTTTSFATGEHEGGHEEYAIGMKGEKAKAKRSITITMRETEDGKMLIEPKMLMFRKNETVALNFANIGKADHEFVMDTEENVQKHRVLMEKNPDMVHADDNSLRLASGEKGQIIWTFAKDGMFTFACLIPGHYEAGMHGKIQVNK